VGRSPRRRARKFSRGSGVEDDARHARVPQLPVERLRLVRDVRERVGMGAGLVRRRLLCQLAAR
jgi:hypothetical protein